MTRKTFNAHVKAASEASIHNVVSVGKGDDDGDVTFVFCPAEGPSIEVGLLALDVAGYPSENSFMIFTKSSDVPEPINQALETVAGFSAGMEIAELIKTISDRLQRVLASGSTLDRGQIEDSAPAAYDNDDDEMESGDEDEDDQYDYGAFPSDDDELDDLRLMNAKGSGVRSYRISADSAAKLNRRIKADLRTTRFAGFKIGIIDGLKAESKSSILSISIQISKLGLSDEVTQAWNLDQEQYIVLLVRYGAGYKTLDAILAEPASSLDISFRIGVCTKYKPSRGEAIAAFIDPTKTVNNPVVDYTGDTTLFRSLFISNSLNDFLNNLLVSLVKIRKHLSMGWDGAKLFYNDQQGRTNDATHSTKPEYFEESIPPSNSFPKMMQADHLGETNGIGSSFPLIAAQFTMRYLLRCTEFCLVCHDKMTGDFEAMKPYVCSNPLCLYQYMSLGFGPSIEHEIMSQPYVVDLLVSFCYAAASSHRIREYPTGMCLLVPPITDAPPPDRSSVSRRDPVKTTTSKSRTSKTGTAETPEPIVDCMDVNYNSGQREIVFNPGALCPVRSGDWIVITTGGIFDTQRQSVHHQVTDISLFPTVRLSEPVDAPTSVSEILVRRAEDSAAPASSPFTPSTPQSANTVIEAKMTIYNQNFDDMDNTMKAASIITLLATLPSIKDIRAYLIEQSSVCEPNLRIWKERISPAALGLLRWIIASNRSCIVQVDQCPGQLSSDPSIRPDQKCANVTGGWVQFSFAQGAPDKEQRFLNAMKKHQEDLDPKYPTLFAFHGSGVSNWHSIIRHGLDFTDTLNGRAYGHGVYHALEQSISISYSVGGSVMWPKSDLQIRSAMSLNEIVNCPSHFTSTSPYLVVQHVDWIQCRYLLVQIGVGAPPNLEVESLRPKNWVHSNAANSIEQDPKYTARTLLGIPIGVPKTALSVSRAFRNLTLEEKVASKSHKKRKQVAPANKVTLKETAISEDEDPEDINFLFSDDEPGIQDGQKKKVMGAQKNVASDKTDFIPGRLDQSELPMLKAPSYATTAATMRLNRDLQAVLRAQETTPMHELGWYIDVELVNNVYQWIVELHSFDPKLPLAKDMKAAGVTSIVLEMRFGRGYPHSPPFVRVIRPRFLPFMNGGGGHVTGGGAMCMELLTNSGWSSASSIEGVLLQVRMAITNLEPKPARLAKYGSHDSKRAYGVGEAMEAYIRACTAHGWKIPEDFKDFSEKST